MAAVPAKVPDGPSRLCLSCHDGTIAMGQTLASGRKELLNAGAGGQMPEGHSKLGTDLSGSHPFSFRPAPSPRMRSPAQQDAVRLDHGGRLQCTSCHDPHREDADPVQKMFLAKDNRGSAICLSCHALEHWTSNGSSHQTSLARFDAELGATTGYSTVADNGCESCHRNHAAEAPKRLLKGADDEVCLRCHAGRVARQDISRDWNKPYAHATVGARGGVHDTAEGPGSARFRLPENRSSSQRHATCVDCHNPHAAFSGTAEAPQVSGALFGVWGIDRNGQRVERALFEYEICFKCHADSVNQPQARGPRLPEKLRRSVTEVNLRRLFDPSSPSFHPVVAPGRNADVPSLIAPLTVANQIYCSDCHASDTGPGAGSQGARGPHGSSWPHLLERALSTEDGTVEGPSAYALCYKCHDRAVLLSERSAFRLHGRHVRDASTPCTACHDPHGVSSLRGNPVNNAHLIDFDVSIVKPNSRGSLSYTSRGLRSGSCSMRCHGVEHQEMGY
jgi:predicted CXXCH cytochrome family protein